MLFGGLSRLAIGLGIFNFVPQSIGSKIALLGCIALILLSSLSIPFAYGPKQDYLGALNFVQENRAANDVVVTVSVAAYPYTKLYLTDWHTVTSVDELDELENSYNSIWLVYTFPPVLESVYPDLMKSITSDFSIVKVFPGTVEGGDIIVCKSTRVNSYDHSLTTGQ